MRFCVLWYAADNLTRCAIGHHLGLVVGACKWVGRLVATDRCCRGRTGRYGSRPDIDLPPLNDSSPSKLTVGRPGP